MPKPFFQICEKEFIKFSNTALSLHIVRDIGLTDNLDVDLTVTHLNKDTNNYGYSHFQYNGTYGHIFKVDIAVRYGEKYEGKQVIDYLTNLYGNARPFYVVTNARNVRNDKYIITKLSSKQTYENEVIYTMECHQVRNLKVIKFKNNNMTIAQAKKNARSKTKSSSSVNNSLKKCKISQMKLNKKNTCCFHLNSKLLKLGYISSKTWKTRTKNKDTNKFTKNTTNALKNFQKKYNTKYKPKKKLTVNGKMNNATLKALTSI